MTRDPGDTLPPRTHRVNRPDGRSRPREQALQADRRTADELDPVAQGAGARPPRVQGRGDQDDAGT